DPGTPGQLAFQRLAQPVRIRARLAEQPGGDALSLIEQREKQVLAVYLGVAEAQRLGLRVVQRFLRLLRQVARVHVPSPGRGDPRRAASSAAIRSSRSV